MARVTQKTLNLVLAGLLATGATVVSAQCWTDRPLHHPSHMELDGCMPHKGIPPCLRGDSHPCIDKKEGYRPHGREFRHEYSGLSFEDRQILLTGKLKLSEAQKSYWDTYSKALEALHQVSPIKPSAQMTQQERLELRVERLKERVAKTEQLAKARSDLLKQLTPEQIEVLESFEHRGARRHYPAPRVSGSL